MEVINRVYDLSCTCELNYVEPSQSMHELLRNNQRSEESEKTPGSINEFITPNMGFRTATRIIEEKIYLSRKTRYFKQAHVFTSDVFQVVPEAVSHHIHVDHLLDVSLRALAHEESAPVYFEPVFEMSWGDLDRVEEFLRSVGLHMWTLMTFLVKSIEDCIQEHRGWFQTSEFLSYSKEDKQRFSNEILEAMRYRRSRIDMCSNSLNKKFKLYIKCRNSLFEATKDLDVVSVDCARKLLKLKDALYFSFEEIEKGVLDIIHILTELTSIPQ